MGLIGVIPDHKDSDKTIYELGDGGVQWRRYHNSLCNLLTLLAVHSKQLVDKADRARNDSLEERDNEQWSTISASAIAHRLPSGV